MGDHHTHAPQALRKHAELAGVQGATSVTLLGTGAGSLFPGGQLPWPPWSPMLPAEAPAGDGESVKLSIPLKPGRTPPALQTSPSPTETKKQVHYCLSLRPGWVQEGTHLPSKRCVCGGGGAGTHACFSSTPSISSVRSFLQEFSQWPLEVFPFHMVAAEQFFRLFIYSYVSRPTTLLAYKQ